MATPFRPAFALLAQYAEYHRDRRNIATHFVGVPMIVLGVCILLARPAFGVAGLALTPAWIVFALVAAWYLSRGETAVTLVTAVGIGLLTLAAHAVAAGSTAAWLGWGVGLFAVGWVIQFVGHHYEGRKPAFADDVVGLLVGPMFVVMEFGALFGLFKGLVERVEAHAGPTHVRDMAAARVH